MRLDVRVLQPRHERRIEAREALAVVKVMEAESVAPRRRVHCRDIRIAGGAIRSDANRLTKPAGPRKKAIRARGMASRIRDIKDADGKVGFAHGLPPHATRLRPDSQLADRRGRHD